MTDITEKPETATTESEKRDFSKVCRYFKKGFCGHGEKCLFSHRKQYTRQCFGSDNPADAQNCRFFKKASCKFAWNCWYKHIKPNGQPVPKPDPLFHKFVVVGPSRLKQTDDTSASGKGTADCDSDVSTAIPALETKTHRGFKRPQNLEIVPRNCVYYEKNGTCYYGEKCWYSHNEPIVQLPPADESLYELESEPDLDHTKMCYNFTFDACEFGDNCAYVHGDICQFCDLALLHPFDEQQRKEHLEACEIFFLEDMEISFAFMRSKFKTCTICLDYVWGLNKLYTKWTFGIQDKCNHIFCLDCIRHWRALKRSKGQLRHCPACRIESSVVVPSTYWFEFDSEKDRWVEAYKAAVNHKPCRFYEKGKCLNGGECHYLHAGFIPPVKERSDDGIWGSSASNNELPSSEQEGPGNLAEGMQDRDQQDARGQNVPDTDCWEDTSSEDQTNKDLALQSGEQVSTSSSADEHQCDGSLGQVNIAGDGAERNVEKKGEQDSDIWKFTPPEDQPSGEQEDPGNMAEETKDNIDDRDLQDARGQNVPDTDSCEDMLPEDQTNKDLALQSGEQVSISNLADEHQCDDSLAQVNIADEGAERDVEKKDGQDPDISPPEFQSIEDSVLQSAEQISASNLAEEMAGHQFDDNLGQVDEVDDKRNVEGQIIEQDPGDTFDSSSQDQPHNLTFSSGE